MIVLCKEFRALPHGYFVHDMRGGEALILLRGAHHWTAALGDNSWGYGPTPEATILELFELLGEVLDDHRRESMNRDMYERAMQRHVDYLEDLCKSK